jgi:hypothetical protein
VADKDTRPICCHCGRRMEWNEPMAKAGTKRAHWPCDDAAPLEARLWRDHEAESGNFVTPRNR